MKNLLLIILAAASIVFAQTPEEISPNQKQPSLDTHSGVYFEASIGGKLIDYSHDSKDGWFSSYEEEIVHGEAISAGFKVGWLEKNHVAAYGTFEYTYISGGYKYTEHKAFSSDKIFDKPIDAHTLYLGAGMLFYPFRNPKSTMRGSYIGASIGYINISGKNSSQEEYLRLNGDGFGFNFELGKGWHITEHWLLGLGGVISTSLMNKTNIESNNPKFPANSILIDGITTNIGLEVKVIRK